MSHVLVVDDEPTICWGFRELLHDEGHQVTITSSAEDALKVAGRIQPDAVLLDVRLPGMDGLTALSRLKEKTGDVPFIVVTAFGSLDTAVRAVEAGAFDYLSKPFDLEDAAAIIRRALDHRSAPVPSAAKADSEGANDTLIGTSPPMQTVFRQIALVAKTGASVLIQGETGTGKELVARAIHRHSHRFEKAFVPVSLSSLNESSIERVLLNPHDGLIPRAEGGTLFLDGLDDLPPPLQSVLRRFIDRRELPGFAPNKTADFRIIASSRRDLAALVESGDFRDDLFYDLSVVRVTLPPLRSRREDIPLLARHFLDLASRGQPREFSPSALANLCGRPWPGNIRELRNVVENAAALSRNTTIELHQLPAALTASAARPESSLLREVMSWSADQLSSIPDDAEGGTLYDDLIQLLEPVLLKMALQRASGNRAAAARLLGLHRATLRQKLRQHGLDDNSQD